MASGTHAVAHESIDFHHDHHDRASRTPALRPTDALRRGGSLIRVTTSPPGRDRSAGLARERLRTGAVTCA
jgi:hypothetical protein